MELTTPMGPQKNPSLHLGRDVIGASRKGASIAKTCIPRLPRCYRSVPTCYISTRFASVSSEVPIVSIQPFERHLYLDYLKLLIHSTTGATMAPPHLHDAKHLVLLMSG